jgi:hypothetical protein
VAGLKKIYPLIWILIILMTACAPAVQSASPLKTAEFNVTQQTAEMQGTGLPEVVTTNTPLLPSTATATPEVTATVAVTATEDTRPLPEDWKEWPVMPEITNRVYEIYALGQELGNDPHRFSKIGDCHSVKEAFMGLFDKPGWYKLRDGREHLQESIDWFNGSFDRDGYSVKGGYNAAAVLSPLWADPQTCLPGENPVECEVRVNKPAFAFISLEVWWQGRTAEQYEIYMHTIIDYLLEHGVVPILATKADNVEGDYSLNLTTAKLAYDYNLPLWNFWKAAQELPNHGMDPTRDDGFHISYAAWTVRSFTALETLDNLWQQVNEN